MSSGSNVCFQTHPDTCSLGAELFSNVIHDGQHYNYGAQGIYMDEQAASVNITSNIISNVSDAGIYLCAAILALAQLHCYLH